MSIRDSVSTSIKEISEVTETNSAITEEVNSTIEEQANQIAIISSYTQKLSEESNAMRTLIETLKI